MNSSTKIHTWVTLTAWAFLAAMAGFGVLFGQAAGHDRLAIGLTAFLLFVAAGTVGSALGFLFGLPRSRLSDQVTLPGTSADTGSAPLSSGDRYLANADPIKVSHWLTTIVVGLGLVNLGHAVPALRDLGAALRAPLGGTPQAGAVALAILLSGSLAGFMLCYLWTSMRVRALLEESERRQEVVPDLVGQTVAGAATVLGNTGLELAPDGLAPDSRIGFQSPPAGKTVLGGTEVTIEGVRP
ncbi:PASTA domain-containing protein [Geodermatophilus saharensis]|uniref:PASTA domain-containing protein n=1 Tax=Geodermatophilus saharensis TaxID=1137994 RepID=A0A239I0N0_9ACTN|nr:PASTA domain-containing protein [Geodermatophilus saharensis]SNS85984.1 PASTA domain-containing protein [Geodermatophilus saharensis]